MSKHITPSINKRKINEGKLWVITTKKVTAGMKSSQIMAGGLVNFMWPIIRFPQSPMRFSPSKIDLARNSQVIL
jgi:hypothetical protein